MTGMARSSASHISDSALRTVKRTGSGVLASGLPYRLAQARVQRTDPVTVLVYHTIGPDDDDVDTWTLVRIAEFRRQIAYLKSQFDIISLDDAVEGTRKENGRPRAVLTFDDGDVGLHTFLLPFVEEEQVPVTVYLATGQIETGELYWFDQVMNALGAAGPMTIDLRADGLRSWDIGHERGSSNWAAISDILETLKTVPNDKRAEICEVILDQAARHSSHAATQLAPLTVGQVAELAESQWISFGSHSHCHNMLDQITIDDAKDSIEHSRKLIESWSDKAVKHFAYPNGNHNPRLATAVEDMGFHSATILGMEHWDGRSDLFALPRIAIGRYDSFERFKLRLAGI